MIHKALTFLTDYLNEQFKVAFEVNEALVVMGNPKGEVAGVDDFENKIVISLVNIQEEMAVKPRVRRDSVMVEQEKPLGLNLQLLISANFRKSNYLEGLRLLSFVVNILHQTPHFSKTTFPNLKDPIEQLAMEMSNISTEELSQIWQAMGANLSPSLVYKMRILGVSNSRVERRIPAVK